MGTAIDRTERGAIASFAIGVCRHYRKDAGVRAAGTPRPLQVIPGIRPVPFSRRLRYCTVWTVYRGSTLAAPSKREKILASAARIVADAGAAHLTIDAVAAEARVSKGGVLYHFPSKRALLEGMLERLIEQLQARTDTLRAGLPDPSSAPLMARVLQEYDMAPAERAMSRAILAAAAENPAMLAGARQLVREAFAEVADASRPAELGWVVLLAVEGLRFLEMLNLLPFTKADRNRVHEALLKLAQEHSL